MFQIAIDGPSGAGKSTIAKAIAAKMGIVYVDTGALYRTIGYFVRQNGVAQTDTEGVISLLPQIKIEVKYENGTQCVYLNGENLGDKIREPEISMYASTVSKIPQVRSFLLDTQRSIAASNSVVMDGRDIGTVILPNADVKIFLTASNEKRAERRVAELLAKGMEVTYEEVLSDMIARDEQDRNRDIAPAVPAEDSILLDTSDYTLEQSIDKAIEIIEQTLAKKKDKRSGLYKLVYFLFNGLFRLIFRMKIVGRENEPKDGGFLICCNHLSALDVILVAVALKKHQPRFMGKKELFRIPLLSGLIRALGAYPVDRGGSDVGAVKNSIRLLQQGHCVALFPQGTRQPNKDPRDTKVRNGAAMIAMHANATVLPMNIYREGYSSKWFRRTVVSIGKPIRFADFAYDRDASGEYARISEEIFDQICKLGEDAEECLKK
ncbi:MAG: (d)CMP kinase [Clostridia bacterium]|nr:(d)CMP kinase [Clostridia bacterium]